MIDLQLLSLMVVGEYNYGIILFALKLLLYLRIAVMVDMYFSKERVYFGSWIACLC